MKPERWQQITRIFQAALGRPPEERAGFVERECAGDAELRREVEKMIRSHVSAGSFIDRPAYESGAELLAGTREDPLAGRTLGQYRLESLLGEGGMGRVYLARHAQLGRRAAVKVLPEEFTRDASLLARFRQEARAASQLNHPNILTVYEVGEDAGVHFIAAEHVEGETLRARLRAGPLPASEAVRVAEHVASALAKAHAAGVVHRDIKPENVMVDEDGRARVLDFGIAKLMERPSAAAVGTEAPTALKADTDPGTVLGTAGYMSPEQARALDVDGRADVWSLGVLLYEMLAGRAPFEGETPADVIASIITKEPRPLASATPDCPPQLQWIVSKALRKDREARYQTAKEMLSDLGGVAEELRARAKAEGADAGGPEGTRAGVAQPAAGGAAARTADAVHTTSSAEYIITEIRRHKRAARFTLAALALVLAAGGYLAYRWRDSAAEIRSVAVLPFENVGGDQDAEYLSDGIAESLINSLSRLPGMRVMARASSFSYKGRAVDPREAGRALNVDAVLTGRVVQRGESLSVQADLVSVTDGSQLWGERYERRAADIISLQQELAREISETMRRRLTGDERQQVSKSYTENAQAYQLYLRGRFLWNKRNPEAIGKAIEEFNRAIELDPGFALAYSGLADCYTVPSLGLPAAESMPKARAAVQRALALDDTLAEAHASLGSVLSDEWDWAGAEREYRRAIELNPNYATAHQWYAELLSDLGRVPEALAEIRRAQELDPLSPMIQAVAGIVLVSGRQYDQALAEFQKALDLDPDLLVARVFLMRTYEWKGRYEEMFAAAERDAALRKNPQRRREREQMVAALREAYRAGGYRAFRQGLLEFQLEERRRGRGGPSSEIAESYAILGDNDQAFLWLNRALEERDDTVTAIKTVPNFDGLRSDPRYAELLRRLNLPL